MRPQGRKMRRDRCRKGLTTAALLALLTLCVLPMPVAASDVVQAPPSPKPDAAGEIQQRGLSPLLREKTPGERKVLPVPAGGPPAQLCRRETLMMTQCKCFNLSDCQSLTALFPNSCPAGSFHCEFVPMSRGPMPTLPPNLCNYQVPFPITRCSCHTQAECQLLSPFCPDSCPPGSQNCECTPLQRR